MSAAPRIQLRRRCRSKRDRARGWCLPECWLRPVTQVGFGPTDQFATDSFPAMSRMDNHHADDAVGKLQCRFVGGRAETGVSKADHVRSIDGDDEAIAVEIGLCCDDIIKDVAAETAGSTSTEARLMPEADQTRKIGILKVAVLGHESGLRSTGRIQA